MGMYSSNHQNTGSYCRRTNNKIMDTDEIFIPKAQSSSSEIISNFTDRQKNLFEHLKKAEDANQNRIVPNETPMETIVERQSIKRKRSETKSLRGKESIFKRPEEPLSKCLPVRHVPDFRKNPQKWKKYSLDHVDISERGNTHAALSFLREMEERKLNDTNEMDIDNSSKVQFNKSAVIRRKNIENDEKSDEKQSFKGTKIVMPEYIVGQSKKNIKKIAANKVTIEAKSKELKLDHLLDYEDDVDD